ncbi:hypothetical protein VTK73DRAFT_9966 [Phialemonium thermophilum]|uniref:Protein-lysine N-methyltransferase EFM4 n=1 Tax=Phialemonium thermophilum TaxID=223376 RepID=A0ABR3VZF3_9PEZI
MAEHPKPAQLEPSPLGTKQYWDEVYATELTNHASNPREEGTVWFDDSDAEAKILDFLESHVGGDRTTAAAAAAGGDDDHLAPPALDKATASFLDLGCGNGSLLFALRDAGWRGPLLGVDYSEASVKLARQVAAARAERRRRRELRRLRRRQERGQVEDDGASESEATSDEEDEDDDVVREDGPPQSHPSASPPGPEDVVFRVWDVLAGPLDAVRVSTVAGAGGPSTAADDDGTTAGWDVVLDKGTFDAVSLSDERDPSTGCRVFEGYGARVLSLLRRGGVFLVTSCNWTEEELRAWFEAGSSGEEDGGGSKLVQVGRVQYPSFSFGGVKGQTISTVCFQKV